MAVSNTSQTTDYTFSNATANSSLTTTFSNLIFPLSYTFNLSAGPTSGTATAGGVTSVNGLTASNSQTNNVSSFLFSLFTGANQSLSFQEVGSNFSYSGTTGAPSNTLFFGGGQTVDATTTLTYTYTANSTDAPEPMSLALLGSGLAGLAALRRRKA